VADVEVVELNWGDRNEQLEAVGSSHRLLACAFRAVGELTAMVAAGGGRTPFHGSW